MEYLSNSERDKARSHQFGKKILPGIFLGCALIAVRIWEDDILIAGLGKLENLDASEIYPRRLHAKEVLITPKRRTICISCCRWFSNIIRERPRIPRSQSETGIHRKERESRRRISRRQGRVSTWRNKRWRRNTQGLLVSSRIFHLSSSHWTESWIIRAQRRVIPFSTEIHWCHQVNSYRFGRSRRKNWRLLERRRKQKSVRFVVGSHKIYTTERNSSREIYVRAETDKNPNDITSRWHIAWRLDKNWKSRSKKRKTRMGNRQTKTRTCQKIERNLFSWSEWPRIQRHLQKLQDESWKHQRQLQCHAKERSPRHAYEKPWFQKPKKPRHLKQRQDSVVLLKPMNPQDRE